MRYLGSSLALLVAAAVARPAAGQASLQVMSRCDRTRCVFRKF